MIAFLFSNINYNVAVLIRIFLSILLFVSLNVNQKKRDAILTIIIVAILISCSSIVLYFIGKLIFIIVYNASQLLFHFMKISLQFLVDYYIIFLIEFLADILIAFFSLYFLNFPSIYSQKSYMIIFTYLVLLLIEAYAISYLFLKINYLVASLFRVASVIFGINFNPNELHHKTERPINYNLRRKITNNYNSKRNSKIYF